LNTKSYNYKGFDIVHTVKPRMRNIYLRIGDDGVVKVSSSRVSQKKIDALIDEKEEWIKKALQKVAQKPQVKLGEEILYLGTCCRLEDDPLFHKLHQKCQKATDKEIILHYQNFYKKEAQHYLSQAVEEYADRMGLQPKEMKLRRMKRQWGNCRSNGVITFNIHLMQAPKECIEYVVVHELAHMVHMNHSKAFHELVKQYLPQSQKNRALLKRFHASL